MHLKLNIKTAYLSLKFFSNSKQVNMWNLGQATQQLPTKTLIIFLKPLTYMHNAGVALVDLINEQKNSLSF